MRSFNWGNYKFLNRCLRIFFWKELFIKDVQGRSKNLVFCGHLSLSIPIVSRIFFWNLLLFCDFSIQFSQVRTLFWKNWGHLLKFPFPKEEFIFLMSKNSHNWPNLQERFKSQTVIDKCLKLNAQPAKKNSWMNSQRVSQLEKSDPFRLFFLYSALSVLLIFLYPA